MIDSSTVSSVFLNLLMKKDANKKLSDNFLADYFVLNAQTLRSYFQRHQTWQQMKKKESSKQNQV